MDARESAVCRCNVGFSKISPDKHVDVCADSDEDRGSNPLASKLLILRALRVRNAISGNESGNMVAEVAFLEAAFAPRPRNFERPKLFLLRRNTKARRKSRITDL